jgi:hypothetical protein
MGIEFFSSPPRPTQSHIQWILAALSQSIKLPEREADHSPPSVVEDKNM